MRVTAISGYGVKGPAAFLAETHGKRLLLDLGQGPDRGRRPSAEEIGPVDAILVSHGHADHVGALDLAPQLGKPPIWCTEAVGALQSLNRFGELHSLPLGGEVEILGIPVLTGRAGHAPGGVWMRIGGEEGLLYSGDVSFESILYDHDPLPRAAGLIVDASYGDYDRPLSEGVEQIAQRAAAGPLLLPAPAGGRGLEMAVELHERGFEVGLCPAHCRMMETLLAAPGVLRPAAAQRLLRIAEAAGQLSEAAAPHGVMIAGAAHVERGMAADLVRRWAGEAVPQIVFTGHVAEDGIASRLVAEDRAAFVRWNVHPRLSDLRAIIAATGARKVMPAFLPQSRIAGLAEALGEGDRLVGPTFEMDG